MSKMTILNNFKMYKLKGYIINVSFVILYFLDILSMYIISRKSGQKIPKIANLQYYKSKANYGTKKKGISR